MKRKCLLLLYLTVPLFLQVMGAQNSVAPLFLADEVLPTKLTYSNKTIRKSSKENAIFNTELTYYHQGSWHKINTQLKVRGNFRRKTCYFPPVKLKIKSSPEDQTIFDGIKKLKIVLPCLLQKRSNDDILKEYLAYKMFENLSDIHFKSRLINLEYNDQKDTISSQHPMSSILFERKKSITDNHEEEVFAARKNRKYQLRAIFIEDDKSVAKRHDANLLERAVHPLNQDAKASIRNALFQFMIGNTDFSTGYGHNQKLLFIDKKTAPIPYDFDMSGLVNASYSVVSNIGNNPLPISKVTERLYRGFKRDPLILDEVKEEFLKKKESLLSIIDDLKPLFDEAKEHQKAKKYIQEFFIIIENNEEFNKQIISKSRIK